MANDETCPRSADGTRAGAIAQLLRRAEVSERDADAGVGRALAGLIVDAVLEGDEQSLAMARDGLQELYAAWRSDASADEARAGFGESLALLSVVDWALKRLRGKPGGREDQAQLAA